MGLLERATNSLIYLILKAPIVPELSSFVEYVGEEIAELLRIMDKEASQEELVLVTDIVQAEMKEGPYTGYSNYISLFEDFLEEIGATCYPTFSAIVRYEFNKAKEKSVDI